MRVLGVNNRRFACGCGLLAVTLALSAAPAEKRLLSINFIDVDGGAATLIVTPERESILIDTGWSGFDERDASRIDHVVRDVEGLDHIDHLVITHWHADHFGGVQGVVNRLRVDHFWDRGLPEDDPAGAGAGDYPDGPKPTDPLGMAYRSASAGKRKPLKAGDALPLKGELKATVLASGGKAIDPKVRYRGKRAPAANPECSAEVPNKPIDGSDNAKSLAILFELGDFAFLDCGDLTWNVEKTLVCPVDLIGQADLYQVTHHGLDSSNHPLLVRTIKPTVAIMNNGPAKGGSPAVVRLLKSVPSLEAAYQLHKNQATGSDDNTSPELIANSDPAGGGFFHVAVDSAAKTFRVRVGAEGPERTFAIR